MAASRILIVEDDQNLLTTLEYNLLKEGYQVITAVDGAQALEITRNERPDLIILDNIMPNMSGWDFTRAIKNDNKYKEYKNTPIIMFSAMNEVKDKIEGLELGVENSSIRC